MKVLRLVAVVNFFFEIIKCEKNSFDLRKIIEDQDFYQVTIFISRNYTGSVDLFPDIPTVTHSFHLYREMIPYASEHLLYKGISALQDSLVIFYASFFEEFHFFIDFLMSETFPSKKEPKCLIIMQQSTAADNQEMTDVLKYAWLKKFLDFTIMVKTIIPLIYYYNPFNDIVYEKLLENQDAEIFPDKLRNTHGYPFRISYFDGVSNKPNKIARYPRDIKYFYEVNDFFKLSFVARCLSLNVVGLSFYNESLWFRTEFMEEHNLDVLDDKMVLKNNPYFTGFFITTDEPVRYAVAMVPIIPLSQFGMFFKIFYNLMIITGLILGFSLLYSCFIERKVRQIEAFDIVLMLLGQSIRKEPKKLLHIIIILTVMIVSFIFVNDILSDVLSISFEKREMPFDTYEDLYNSKLQTYTELKQLLDYKYLNQYIHDPTLLKVLKNTNSMNDDEDLVKVIDQLIKYKNVSIIVSPFGLKNGLAPYYTSDGYEATKIAQPPILTVTSAFYFFSNNSPFGMRFLEVLRRIQETKLFNWPILVDPNRKYYDYEEPNLEFDTIKLEHLLTVLSAGYLISIIFFGLEFVYFKIDYIEKLIKLKIMDIIFLFFYYKNKLWQKF